MNNADRPPILGGQQGAMLQHDATPIPGGSVVASARRFGRNGATTWPKAVVVRSSAQFIAAVSRSATYQFSAAHNTRPPATSFTRR